MLDAEELDEEAVDVLELLVDELEELDELDDEELELEVELEPSLMVTVLVDGYLLLLVMSRVWLPIFTVTRWPSRG